MSNFSYSCFKLQKFGAFLIYPTKQSIAIISREPEVHILKGKLRIKSRDTKVPIHSLSLEKHLFLLHTSFTLL